MPEIIEVEYYRRAAERLVGRTVATVDVDDAWVRGGDADAVRTVLGGSTVDSVSRHGKVLSLGLAGRPTLGVRFGMTGRLVVDGDAPIDRLEYSSGRDEPGWDRFAVTFDDGGRARVNDPRRLGSVEISPDLDRLGPDAWSLHADELTVALESAVALKTRLLDQRRVAGLGNLLVDEVLWRCGLAPAREAASLHPDEIAGLAATVLATLDDLDAAGGSHRGELHMERRAGGLCPRDGTGLRRDRVGGRTTVWCPVHQR